SSRENRRAAPRDTADHQRARRNVATVSRSARGQERDINQGSNWRRNRTVDDEVAAASSWGVWQDRDADQRSSRIDAPTTTFQPRVLSAAGRIATSIKRRVGEGTGMTNIPVGMIVASSTGPHARTIA